jgi:hypothetical protein
MEKLQNYRGDVLEALSKCLAACELTHQELAKGSGVSYHAARRYRISKRAKNLNNSARALCDFFKIPIPETANLQTDQLAKKMKRAIQEVWDGSEHHADLITRLIRATKKS